MLQLIKIIHVRSLHLSICVLGVKKVQELDNAKQLYTALFRSCFENVEIWIPIKDVYINVCITLSKIYPK